MNKQNLLLTLFFMAYVALFTALGAYINDTYLFPTAKLLTFEFFDVFALVNFVGLTVWGAASLLKKDNLFKLSNFIIYILSALSFAFLCLIHLEAKEILDYAHWPLSNLYEVSIVLYAITTILAFYFVKLNKKITLFLYVLLVIELGLIVWLESLGQNMYKELMPALKSYWLPTHVAFNFIGYGSFAIAGMAGLMGLIKHYTNIKLLPSVDVAENLSFKAIAFGFPLFTIATILGSLWAYEAWGAYWSWDPKETWALIVWLIYAIYLHLRVTNRVSKNTLCIISFIALLATAFCFLGVNLYLSGLHSYGQLS